MAKKLTRDEVDAIVHHLIKKQRKFRDEKELENKLKIDNDGRFEILAQIILLNFHTGFETFINFNFEDMNVKEIAEKMREEYAYEHISKTPEGLKSKEVLRHEVIVAGYKMSPQEIMDTMSVFTEG